MKINERIGAVLSADSEQVMFLGWGVYGGREESPPENIATMMQGIPNPKLIMDDGNVIWGCECWWAPEEKIKEMIGARRVVNVDINLIRSGKA